MGLSTSLKTIKSGDSRMRVATDDELKRLKELYLDMTSFIKKVCDDNGIEWGLCGGSALGAIRHKGFIPWDDDIDICMTRENYKKFASAFALLDQDRYELLSPGDKDNYWHFPRLYDKKTKLITMQSVGRGTGIPIDIFLVEDMYDNRIRDYLHGIRCTYYLFVISCLTTHKRKEQYIKYGNDDVIKKVKLRDAFSLLFRFRSVEKWIAIADRYFGKINNPKSVRICCPTGVKHYFGEIYRRKDMCRFKLMPFEDREFPVYVGVHRIMKKRYGDTYMQLPPESTRERHAFLELDLGDAFDK